MAFDLEDTREERKRLLLHLDGLAEQALAAYELPSGCHIERAHVSENVTYRVERAGRSFAVLRSYRPAYNRVEEIASELEWLEALKREATMRVPGVYRSASGERIVQVRDPLDEPGARRCFAMFEHLEGKTPTREEALSRLPELGTIAAWLHRHGRAWRRRVRVVRRTWDVASILGSRPAWGTWRAGPGVGVAEERVFSRVEQEIRRQLGRYGKKPDRFGLVHADLRRANLLLDGSGLSVIDFDDCGFGWYLFDLATAIVDLCGSGDEEDLLWEACLSGYRAIDEPPGDQALLGSFGMLRRLMTLAWLGSRERPAPPAGHGAEAFCTAGEHYLAGTSKTQGT